MNRLPRGAAFAVAAEMWERAYRLQAASYYVLEAADIYLHEDVGAITEATAETASGLLGHAEEIAHTPETPRSAT